MFDRFKATNLFEDIDYRIEDSAIYVLPINLER